MFTKSLCSFICLATTMTELVAGAALKANHHILLSRQQQEESLEQKSLGAFYFMSNDKNINRIVSSTINTDGTLTPAFATSTGGKGGSGTVDPPAEEHPDALFTQGSVTVSKNMLFNVNPGDNTMSMFTIDKKNPTKLELVATVDTGGQFPASVAANKAATMACALNSGGNSSFMCFNVNKKGMTPLKDGVRGLGVKQSDVPAGPGGTVSDIVFMNDGNLAVSVKGTGPDAPGNVQTFSVVDGQISEEGTKTSAAKGGALPFSLSVPMDGSNQLFATDAGAGVSTFDFSKSKANEVGQSTLTAIDGQGATCWSTQTKTTGSFFVTDVLTSQVTEFDAPKPGKAAKQLQTYDLGNQTGTIDLAAANTKSGDFVFVVGAMAKTITAMSTGKTAGNAEMVQTLDLEKEIGKKLSLTMNMQGAAVFVQ